MSRHSTHVLRRLFVTAVVCAVALVGSGAAGATAGGGDWHWSPGLCKSKLYNQGVTLDDGRYFFAERSSCIGRGGPQYCMWNSSGTKRLYNTFFVYARSYEGVVRSFDLRVTGEHSARISNIKAHGRISAAQFAGYVAPIAASIARNEHEKGCSY